MKRTTKDLSFYRKAGDTSFSFEVKEKDVCVYDEGCAYCMSPRVTCTVTCEYWSTSSLGKDDKAKQVISEMLAHGKEYDLTDAKYLWDERDVRGLLEGMFAAKIGKIIRNAAKDVLEDDIATARDMAGTPVDTGSFIGEAELKELKKDIYSEKYLHEDHERKILMRITKIEFESVKWGYDARYPYRRSSRLNV